MNGTVTLIGSKIEDFEDYYNLKCGRSEIYWIGFAGKPDKEKLRACFRKRLGDNDFGNTDDKRVYMIKVAGRNVGTVLLTLDEEGVEFAISILEEEQGKGYGTEAIRLAIPIAKQYSNVCHTEIRDDNYASQKALTRAGFRRTDEFYMKEFPGAGLVGYRKYYCD